MAFNIFERMNKRKKNEQHVLLWAIDRKIIVWTNENYQNIAEAVKHIVEFGRSFELLSNCGQLER